MALGCRKHHGMPQPSTCLTCSIAARENAAPDIEVQNEGSIFLVRALTDAGREWMAKNIYENDETQHFGGALVVEHRYIADIVCGMRGDGLKVEEL